MAFRDRKKLYKIYNVKYSNIKHGAMDGARESEGERVAAAAATDTVGVGRVKNLLFMFVMIVEFISFHIQTIIIER